MEFRILGPLEVLSDAGAIDIRGQKPRSLLAILLINANHVVSMDRVIDALWGEEVPATAENNVQVQVSTLRRAFRDGGETEEVLITRRPGYLLRVDDARIDAKRFQLLAADGSRAVNTGDYTRAAGVLRDALGMWRGDPLEEFSYEAFARAEIDKLEELRLSTLENRIESDLALGRHGEILAEIDALVVKHPLSERLRGHQMLALYRMGRQAEALDAYRDLKERLADELGIDPSPALQRLESAILQQDPSLELASGAAAPAAPAQAPTPDSEAGAVSPAPLPSDEALVEPTPEPSLVPDGGGGLGGATFSDERKTVTVLFCDIVDATGFASSADPEDVWARLRRYHAVVREEITKYGGTLEKFQGDGVPGFFGAPVAHDNDPERAIRAALRIVDAIDHLNESIVGPSLVVRIGITTGLVLVPGAPAVGEGIVFGDAVNTASRLQSAAAPGTIIVDESTRAATRNQFEFESLPPLDLRGKPGPTIAYRVLRPSSRPPPERTGDYTTAFVAREAELSLMKAAYSRAVRGDGMQLISISGESGIGKTRLVWELFRFVDNGPDLLVRWRRGRCLQYGDGITFWALGEIVKAEAGIFETDDIETTQSKLLRVLPETQDRDWLYQRMLPLVGIGSEAAPERDELFAAWRRFIENLASEGPAVLVFEDIHWADDAMLAFLEDLIERADPVPLVIVATARPELFDRLPSWANAARNAMRINVGPLNQEETDELVTGLLRHFNESESAARGIVELSGGNPLHAEEYVRYLRDQSALGDGAEPNRAVPVPLPATINALIAARLDTLSPGRKQLLADAAVVGEVFWSGALAFMARAPRSDTEDALRELSRRDLVIKVPSSSMSGEREYRFRHALIRDVAYEQIPRAPRAERHLAVARWVETVASDRLEDLAEILASHYERALALLRLLRDERAAQVQELALRYLMLAGERAMGLDVGQADEQYRRALDLAGGNPEARADILAHLAQLAQLAHADLTESARLCREAIEALEAVGQTERAAELQIRLAVVVDNQGDRDGSIEIIDDVIARLEALGPSPVLAHAYAERSYPLWCGSTEEAIDWANRALDLADKLDLPEIRATALGFRGATLVDLGQAEGLIDEREALAVSIEAGLTSKVYTNYANLLLGMSRERPSEALELAANGLAFARSHGLVEGETMIRVARLEPLFQTGQWAELITESEDLHMTTTSHGDRWGTMSASFPRAWALAITGRLDLAVDLIDSLAIANHEVEWAMCFAGPLSHARRITGDHEGAAKILSDVIEQRESAGQPLHQAYVLWECEALARTDLLRRCLELCTGDMALFRLERMSVDAAVDELAGRHQEAERKFDFVQQEWTHFGNPFEHARALLGQGRCLLALGKRGAHATLRAAQDVLEAMGIPPPLDS